MEDKELREAITKLLKEGRNLSEIHEHVTKTLGHAMTFLDLRVLISELSVDLPEEKEDTPPPPPPPPPQRGQKIAAPGDAKGVAKAPAGGATTVSVDAVTRPGVELSGKFRTKSGATGAWYMDQYGRVALEAEAGSAKPSRADMAELQEKLGEALRRESGAL